MTRNSTKELESDSLQHNLSALLESAKRMKLIPQITFVECMQQIGSDCALNLLKNIECCVKLNDLLIRKPSNKCFTFGAKSWYEKSDATDLRIQIINFLREDAGRIKLEGKYVGRITL